MRRASGFPRPRRAGAVGALVCVLLGVGWTVLAGAPWATLFWFVAVAAAQAFLPGIANQVTTARAYLAAPALFYALTPHGFGGLAATVALAGATDLLDGRIARRFEKPTQLGGGLDPVVDGLFFGATALGLAAGHAYPWWLFGLVAARYGLPAVVGGVLVLAKRPVKLSHTFFGQISTALIGVLLGWVALWRGLGLEPGRIVTAAEVIIPVATALTFANLAWVARGVWPGGLGPSARDRGDVPPPGG